MSRRASRMLALLVLHLATGAIAFSLFPAQRPIDNDGTAGNTAVTVPFFAELERLARLVDIAYCVGNTGVTKPFECMSRCKEFPTLSLATTWNTGILLSDSCGYIAVDHGARSPEDTVVSGGLDVDRRAIVVAFRGTYSVTNTVIDLSTVPQKYRPYPSPEDGGDEPAKDPKQECKNCTVHMGFFQSWKNARKYVLPELDGLRTKYPDYPIHLVGHSLGGAVACLAALEMKVALGWDNIEITTFGEPRLGNYNLARFVDEVFDLDTASELEKRSYRRVTHREDPVPLLPLGEWGFRSHAGEIYISKKDLSPSEKDVRTCIGDSDPECSGGADSTLPESLLSRLPVDEIRIAAASGDAAVVAGIPTRYKLWQLFFAHRDYFWRLGLCVPGGDPANWGRDKYGAADPGEL